MEKNLLIKTINLSKKFPGVLALDNINFNLIKGEIHAIVGENGAGKSTFINIIGGILEPNSGIIEFEGLKLHSLDPLYAKKLGISIIHQESELALSLSVAENIFLGKYPGNKIGIINYNKMRKDAKEILKKVCAEINTNDLVKDLTIPQRRLIELARAISTDIKLLIMDEPTTVFSSEEIKNLFEIVRLLKRNGVTVIFISHNLNEIYSISDRVTVFRDGKLITTVPVKEATEENLIRWMVGRDFKLFSLTKSKKIGKEVLTLKNISKKGVIENISFGIREGEIIGLAGLVGSGRTSIANIIFGILRPDSGHIFIYKNKTNIQSPSDAISKGIGLLTEDRKLFGLFLTKTIKDNIAVANLNYFSKFTFINQYREKAECSKFIKLLNIKAINVEQIVENLSGGNQQKVVFARWLLNKPKILILDEPTVGIDIGAKQEMYKLISNISNEGCAILLVSSEIPELIGLCDRILVMRNGYIVKEFLNENLTQEKILYYSAGFYERSKNKLG